MSAHATIALPEPLFEKVRQRANTSGRSAQQWIEFIVSEHIRLEEETSQFFARRAIRASGRPLRDILHDVGDNPPDAGDELIS